MRKKLLALPRALTPAEKKDAQKFWPKMDVDKVVVTDEATVAYNCLAWTLGITTSWVWPWVGHEYATQKEFDALYATYGFKPAGSGEIAGLGMNADAFGHGSISGAGHGPRWESKCGKWLRIQHGLGEMEGGVYGNVYRFYTHTLARFEQRERLDADMLLEASVMAIELSKDEQTFLERKVKSLDARLKKEFGRRYQAWRVTWEHPLIACSSAPSRRTNSIEFLELTALGGDIVPLLMDKLRNPDEFFALQVLEKLVRPELFPSRSIDDPGILAGEQGRAREVLKRWIALEI